jgi:hypothetical protein
MIFFGLVAGTTGLEPATSAVTGQRSNQLSYVPKLLLQQDQYYHMKTTRATCVFSPLLP